MGHYDIDQMAKTWWQFNLALQDADNDSVIDDPWVAVPESRKKLVRDIVEGVISGALNDPQDTHEYWFKVLTNAGWHKGPKDNILHLHPSLRPWEELESWEQLAHEIGMDIIHRMMRA